MKRLLYRFPEGCAVCEDGRLTEYISLTEETQSGDVILAKVDRIMSGMDCAFADIGRKKNGFLPLNENSRSFTDGPIHSGDRIAVQIRREENGEKGAFLSRDLTIPGKAVILMPKNRYIGVSHRISDEMTRERLRCIGQRIAQNQFGLVMRASSENIPEDEILAESEELLRIWECVQKKLKDAGRPGDVLFVQDPVSHIVDDYALSDEDVIQLPDMPAEISRQLYASTDRKVKLPGGGNIVIDRCEAMTVIDVNSASAACPGCKESTVTASNLEACTEAAVQIRLRDIAGIIMIDFIDMEKDEDRDRILDRLKEEFSQDRRKTVIHGWTKLGIMEMTRKRI